MLCSNWQAFDLLGPVLFTTARSSVARELPAPAARTLALEGRLDRFLTNVDQRSTRSRHGTTSPVERLDWRVDTGRQWSRS
jgi:hypothetical protein